MKLLVNIESILLEEDGVGFLGIRTLCGKKHYLRNDAGSNINKKIRVNCEACILLKSCNQ